MRILPEDRRDAMFAIYAFCRAVDDIADGSAAEDQKRSKLDEWRRAIDSVYADEPLSEDQLVLALSFAIRAYGLEKKDFYEVIAGMEMDIGAPIVAPDWSQLLRYCDRVAGAVGQLSVYIFGDSRPKAQQFAIALGTALQLTNILRDLKDDAGMGRLYLPRELIDAQGIEPITPSVALDSPKLPEICAGVADMAYAKYTEAENLLRECDARALKPAIVMMVTYRKILDRIIAKRWRDLDDNASLTAPQKVWITLRYGLL
jgi:phytoene synthase